MSHSPKLSPEHLIKAGWERYKANPGLILGMWIVYAMFNNNGGFNVPNGGGEMDKEVLIALVLIGLGVSCLFMLIGPPIRAGFQVAYARIMRGDDTVTFGDIFAGFKRYIDVMLCALLLAVIVVCGMLLFIVPGVIAAIGLWPAYLLVMEDDMPPIEALKAAWALTDGHKMQLFLLGLACGLLNIAGLFACCVGLFATGPASELAWAEAYNELRRAQASEQDTALAIG